MEDVYGVYEGPNTVSNIVGREGGGVASANCESGLPWEGNAVQPAKYVQVLGRKVIEMQEGFSKLGRVLILAGSPPPTLPSAFNRNFSCNVGRSYATKSFSLLVYRLPVV